MLSLCILALLWIYRSPLLPWQSSTLKYPTDKGEEFWKWTQHLQEADGYPEKKTDWSDCRDKVRDAFIITFEGYEKEAWGMSLENLFDMFN